MHNPLLFYGTDKFLILISFLDQVRFIDLNMLYRLTIRPQSSYQVTIIDRNLTTILSYNTKGVILI